MSSNVFPTTGVLCIIVTRTIMRCAIKRFLFLELMLKIQPLKLSMYAFQRCSGSVFNLFWLLFTFRHVDERGACTYRYLVSVSFWHIGQRLAIHCSSKPLWRIFDSVKTSSPASTNFIGMRRYRLMYDENFVFFGHFHWTCSSNHMELMSVIREFDS